MQKSICLQSISKTKRKPSQISQSLPKHKHPHHFAYIFPFGLLILSTFFNLDVRTGLNSKGRSFRITKFGAKSVLCLQTISKSNRKSSQISRRFPKHRSHLTFTYICPLGPEDGPKIQRKIDQIEQILHQKYFIFKL